jgi:hypothetical protein
MDIMQSTFSRDVRVAETFEKIGTASHAAQKEFGKSTGTGGCFVADGEHFGGT